MPQRDGKMQGKIRAGRQKKHVSLEWKMMGWEESKLHVIARNALVSWKKNKTQQKQSRHEKTTRNC